MQINAITADTAPAFAGDLLLAEYVHRAANDFAVACTEVHVAGREATLEQTRARLATVSRRLIALAEIQRLLLPPRRPFMDLGAELGVLCRLHTEARFAEQRVFVQLHAEDTVVDARRGWAMLAIVSELLTNAARHAFGGEGGVVSIDIAPHGGDILCTVSDDGIGMGRKSAGLGCGGVIVAELARRAGIAMIRRPRRVGTRFELRLPIEH